VPQLLQTLETVGISAIRFLAGELLILNEIAGKRIIDQCPIRGGEKLVTLVL
jgi:hypothetical protein